MENIKKVAAPGRAEVEILETTFEPGLPSGEEKGRWSVKLESRSENLKYLKTGQRYFCASAEDAFGSEKRKKPA